MVSYIIAKIVSLNKKTITVEHNYCGYSIFVPNINEYEIGRIKKIYVYKTLSLNSSKNKIIEEMYGFTNYETKELFLKLLLVQGIGCRTAINICNNDIPTLKQLINNREEDALLKLNGITPKILKQMLETIAFDDAGPTITSTTPDLVRALKTLGYGKKDIENAINNIDISKQDLSELIADAIKHIAASCHLA
ncbi:MAG: hypothetical protein LBB95_01005 [Mycoplasmataceae bacterium]|jgi:Holliday junction DNA helicase RuvA|nr:hypothetical protein [Mycoplasmataceae bacterium]